MNLGTEQEKANATAEEILRHIYGDDFQGCTVSLESIAKIVLEAIQWKDAQDKELFELHEKVVEAVDLLSTPPAEHSAEQAGALLSLLGQRLDGIHTITQKFLQTIATIKSQREDEMSS